jgi:hypothetical protein
LICSAIAPEIEARGSSSQDLDQLMLQLECQILRDGVGAEQSPTYAAFSLELAIIAFLSLNVAPEQLPTPVRERLLAWTNYVEWISSPSGYVPNIGDCDDCKVVGLEGSAAAPYVVSIAGFVKSYLNGTRSLPSRILDLRDVIFFPSTPSPLPTRTPPLVGAKTWKAGGYTVWRQRPSNPIVLVFDHGPLGYLSIAAHAHADALSVWLSVGDTPVFVDAGTYVYNSAPIWRERFRGSALHNTLSISGMSSSSTSGPFNWAAKAQARLVSDSEAGTNEVVAEHDGYLKRFGVRHRRSVSMCSEGRIRIVDELIGGSADLHVQISFLVNPDLTVRIDHGKGSSIIVEEAGRPVVELSHEGPLKPQIAFGDGETGRGWVSPSFGKLRAAHQIMFEGLLSNKSVIRMTPSTGSGQGVTRAG